MYVLVIMVISIVVLELNFDSWIGVVVRIVVIS